MELFDLSCVAQCCRPQTTVDQPVIRQVQGGELVHHVDEVPDFSKLQLGAIALRQAHVGWNEKHPMCITSMKEGKPHSITHVNKAFTKMVRLKRRDIIRQPLGFVFGNATDKTMSGRLLRHLATGTIGANMTMIIYPFPQDGLSHAPRKWVEVDCRPLKDWVGAHAFNKVRFQVGETVRQDIVWYWEKKNEFAHFDEISAFEQATEQAERFGGGVNRAARILQSNQNVQKNQDPEDGAATITLKRPSGEERKQARCPPKVKPTERVTQAADSQAMPDGVLRSIVRSPFALDEANARLASNFQFHRTRVERERLEQTFFAKPDPKLLCDMRRLKESIQKVDGNFVTAGASTRALRDEVLQAELASSRQAKTPDAAK